MKDLELSQRYGLIRVIKNISSLTFYAEAEKSNQKTIFSIFIRRFLWNTKSNGYLHLS